MRLAPAFLCFSLIFSAAPAADPAPSSPTDTYIYARDRALSAVKADPAAEDRALPELERLIKLAVPGWHASGFTPEGTYTVVALDEGDVGFGAVDGLQYARGDTVVTVTTKPLLTRWLAGHRNWWKDEKNIPASMTAAFRSEAFYTQALSTDAAAYLHGLVLVKAPPGAELAVVELAAFAQDLVLDRGPDRLLVVVMRGDRIFIAEEKLKTPLAPVLFCKRTLDLTLAHAKAEKNTDKSDALEVKADREYRDCFGVRLREQPNYTAVQKQAQALVDRLH
jgi:hypothetical protein